jgi:hypothetical protein
MTRLEREVRANLLLFATGTDEIYIPRHKLLGYSDKDILTLFKDEYEIRFNLSNSSYVAFKDKLGRDRVKVEAPGLAVSNN